MGLVIKLQQSQRIYFDDLCLEVSKYKGQIKLHFEGSPPFPFEIKRESIQDYRSRMEEEENEGEVHCLHPKEFSKSTE